MRRHVTLIVSLLVVAAGTTAAGIATADAATQRPNVVRVVVKVGAGSQCNPAQSYCFKPMSLSVARGTRVIWKNPTIAPHTVSRCTTVACNGNGPGTGTQTGFGTTTSIPSGGKYSFVFRRAGTYNYYCMIHGYALMHGTITVT